MPDSKLTALRRQRERAEIWRAIAWLIVIAFGIWWFTWPEHQWPFALPLAWFWLWPFMPVVPLALIISVILLARALRARRA